MDFGSGRGLGRMPPGWLAASPAQCTNLSAEVRSSANVLCGEKVEKCSCRTNRSAEFENARRTAVVVLDHVAPCEGRMQHVCVGVQREAWVCGEVRLEAGDECGKREKSPVW
jgi:hypothetical protein